MPTSARGSSRSGLLLQTLRAISKAAPPGRRAHGRRCDIFSHCRVDPGFDGAPVALPEALQHSHELLAMPPRTQDVVMKNGTTKDGQPSAHLMEGTGDDEHSVGLLARWYRPLHRENRTHSGLLRR